MALSGASRSPVSAPCRRDVHGEVIRPVRGLNTTPLYKGATQDEYKASVLSLRKMKNIKTKPIEHFKTMNSSQCCNNRFQFSANTFHILDCKKNTSELQKNCSLCSCKTVVAVTALKSVFDKGILLPKMIILSLLACHAAFALLHAPQRKALSFLALRRIQKSVRCLRSVGNIQNDATVTRRDREETNC